MRKYLLGSKGFFFKANLHLHTTVSDGEWSPQQAKEEYKRKGYSIIAFTDHEIMVPHHDLTDQNFLALTAFEFAINENIPNATFPFIKTYHLNFYAKKREMTINPFFNERHLWIKQSLLYVNDEMRNINYGPKLYTEECINDIIRKANEQGFLASLNHLV